MEKIPETITDAPIRKRAAFLRLVRKSLWFALPFWALMALYVYDDPFMVLRKYDLYDSDVMLNEQHVGWQIYRNHKDSVHFNSFILAIPVPWPSVVQSGKNTFPPAIMPSVFSGMERV